MQKLIRELLKKIGEDPKREGLKDTPKRVEAAYKELFSGYGEFPKITTFKAETRDLIILKDIEFYSTCEHHMLPFFGKIHIGYIPKDKIIGVSKLARIAEYYSRRLQIQERLAKNISSSIEKLLRPQGVIVIIEAQHLCMTSRGIKKQKSKMVTSSICGKFVNSKVRAEFLELIK